MRLLVASPLPSIVVSSEHFDSIMLKHHDSVRRVVHSLSTDRENPVGATETMLDHKKGTLLMTVADNETGEVKNGCKSHQPQNWDRSEKVW